MLIAIRNQRGRSYSGGRRRQGSIYLAALGSSLIIVCLGLASLQSVRVQRRLYLGSNDLTNARILAKAGIEFGKSQTQSSSSWRSSVAASSTTTQSVNGGNFTVSLTDPSDGVLGNSNLDPVLVTSTGTYGSARTKLSALLEPQKQIFPSCRAALFSKRNIELTDSNIASNHWALCGNQMTVAGSGSSNIDLNCFALGGFSGSGFSQRKISNSMWPIESPNLDPTATDFVAKYYLDNGVLLEANDLPTGGTALIKNSGAEVNLTGWSSFLFCDLNRVTNQKFAGVASCLVSNRWFTYSSPSFNVLEHIREARTYTFSFVVRSTTDQEFYGTLSIDSTDGTTQLFEAKSTKVTALANVWTLVSSSFTPDWRGAITKAECRIYGNTTSNYWVDNVSLINPEWQTGKRYIDANVLSNTRNPYGARIVSPLGIYVVDTPGEQLIIRDSRIRSTLVVKNALSVQIEGSMLWDPVGANYPALISMTKIIDVTNSNDLKEKDIGIDFNPPGDAYNGTADTDGTDSYAEGMVGAVVSLGDIELKGDVNYSGPIYSGNDVKIQTQNLKINYDSNAIQNPPPGFYPSNPKMEYVSGSIQQAP